MVMTDIPELDIGPFSRPNPIQSMDGSIPCPTLSVGVLEDKSSSSRILEDNCEVLGLGLGLEACVLDSITANSMTYID